MIIVTGAAGFIGSCMVKKLNDEGHRDLVLVDDFSQVAKNRNLEGKYFREKIDRDDFHVWLAQEADSVDGIFHLGARTDTTEKDTTIFDRLNLNYTKDLWRLCTQKGIPLIYASSAATYGLGERGYKDDHALVENLKPLNPYGDSKNEFDKWALKQTHCPPRWIGLKFFNVYGPNEYHKGRMASVVFHTHRQIGRTGAMKLFRSHRPDFKDGEQSRDFVYVKDVVAVCYFLFQNKVNNGLYNLGTGQARSFWDLAVNTFESADKAVDISFIDTPEDIRDTYQYYTQADMTKLVEAGYTDRFHTLEEGIRDYVQNYLIPDKIW